MFNQAQVRSIPGAVATIGVSERVTFLRKAYGHLGGAILAFVALTYALLDQSGPLWQSVSVPWLEFSFSSRWLPLILFLGGGWVAQKWASSDSSRGMQYLGLGAYVVTWSFFMLPMLFIAQEYYEGVIADAAVLTLFLFGGLTATVFVTKKDFSFMRGALSMAIFGMLGLIVASWLFGFTLGLVFTGFGILVMSGYVLYYTSTVLHHCRPTQYVAAALMLFSAIAMLFMYILSFVMSLSRD